MSEKTLKLECGMLLVYTSAIRLSIKAKENMHKMLEEEACQAMCRVPHNLPIGIVILDNNDKLEILPSPEMKEHIEKYHTDEKPFVRCTECGLMMKLRQRKKWISWVLSNNRTTKPKCLLCIIKEAQ